jgi:hypothetical protein
VAIIAVALAGCDAAAPYRAIVRDQTAAWEETAEILSRVTDQDSMTLAAKELVKCRTHSAAIEARLRDLTQPSPELAQRLAESPEGQRLKQAVDRTTEQIGRITKLPGGPEFLKHLPGK